MMLGQYKRIKAIIQGSTLDGSESSQNVLQYQREQLTKSAEALEKILATEGTRKTVVHNQCMRIESQNTNTVRERSMKKTSSEAFYNTLD